MGIDAQMFVRVTPPLTEDAVRRLGWEIGEAFGPKRFMINRDGKYGEKHHALSTIAVYQQDGPDIRPKRGEQFIEVHLWTRYYGVDYERGDLPLIKSVAEWLEIKIPNGAVWYGGDSSGVLAKPFDAKAREAMWRHFVSNGHRPYNGYFNRGAAVMTCGFCAEPMNQYGSSGDGHYRSYTCDGCGWHQETRDGGKTWTDKNEAA